MNGGTIQIIKRDLGSIHGVPRPAPEMVASIIDGLRGAIADAELIAADFPDPITIRFMPGAAQNFLDYLCNAEENICKIKSVMILPEEDIDAYCGRDDGSLAQIATRSGFSFGWRYVGEKLMGKARK